VKRLRFTLYAVLLGIGQCATSLAAQEASTPVSELRFNAPAVTRGKDAKVEVNLIGIDGRPISPEKDLELHVTATGAKPSQDILIFPKGQSSATLDLKASERGISSVQFESIGSGASSPIQASTQIAFAAEGNYTPKLPLDMLIMVTPSATIKVSIGKAELHVLIVDQDRVPVPSPRDFEVSFLGLDGVLSPFPLHLKKGDLDSEATISSQSPGAYEVKPVTSPPTTVINEVPEVRFEAPTVGVRLLADPSYVKSVFSPTITIKGGFIDGQGNWSSIDHDTVVSLQVLPPGAGQVSPSNFTEHTGQTMFESQYKPLTEGPATVTAQVEKDLVVEPANLQFYYALWYFLLISAFGGVAGAVVRYCLQAPRPSVKHGMIGILSGVFFGPLAYVFAPLLVEVSFKPDLLQSSSKTLVAFLWGFVGGGSGAALFVRIFQPGPGGPSPGPAV
jgi:hypothetical protein